MKVVGYGGQDTSSTVLFHQWTSTPLLALAKAGGQTVQGNLSTNKQPDLSYNVLPYLFHVCSAGILGQQSQRFFLGTIVASFSA